MGTAPWLMWASTQNISFANLVAPVSQPLSSGAQISRIDYGRPDTWSFFFTAQLIDVQKIGNPGGVLDLYFNLTLGLGRTSVNLPQFEHFQWDTTADAGKLIYSSEVTAPKRLITDARDNIVTEFAAQSINVNALATLAISGVGTISLATVAVNAYFAPRTHVRPEWFKDGTFRGDENGGM